MATVPKQPRVGSNGNTVAERAHTAAKHARVVELANAGWTRDAIASELGYASKSGVTYVIEKWVTDDGPTHEAVEELRQRQLAQLQDIHKTLWPHSLHVALTE
jgi:hypothetical protein